MTPGILAAIAYGVLAVAGGILGYVQARSKISLLAGCASGVLLILSGVVQLQGLTWGLILAAAVTAVLIIAFAIRLAKTRKFMPGGLMLLLGLIAFAVMVRQLVVIP